VKIENWTLKKMITYKSEISFIFGIECNFVILAVPTAPDAVEVKEVTKDSATIQWKVPSNDGGSPILGYFIERSLATSTRWIKISKELVKTLTYTATELVEDNEYIFRVTAENKVGAGPPSEPTKPVAAKDPWRKN